ncbi:hypothetical protein [Nostoc sp. JL23]|uniref:hypothetical protein n=1 Tax=Nostoc sp. JL23 TaxID=2815394 RepID=UPI001DE62950|nr:hypothetical protein [Nostoc sp. JL23]MBN3875256.1 hypothetical protein [Nostoc sp. JL23]
MNSLFLDICADDYKPGQVRTLNDRCGNYQPYIFTGGQLFVNEQGFYSQYNSAGTGIAVDNLLKLSQFYATPNLAVIAVVRTPKENVSLTGTSNGKIQTIWHSKNSNTAFYYLAPLFAIICTNNGRVGLGNILPVGNNIIPYINDEIYIFAVTNQKEKDFIVGVKTEIYTRHGCSTIITNKLEAQVGSMPFNALDTITQHYPSTLVFGCRTLATDSMFMGNIKRCGIYPYSKIQEFKKLYLGK